MPEKITHNPTKTLFIFGGLAIWLTGAIIAYSAGEDILDKNPLLAEFVYFTGNIFFATKKLAAKCALPQIAATIFSVTIWMAFLWTFLILLIGGNIFLIPYPKILKMKNFSPPSSKYLRGMKIFTIITTISFLFSTFFNYQTTAFGVDISQSRLNLALMGTILSSFVPSVSFLMAASMAKLLWLTRNQN